MNEKFAIVDAPLIEHIIDQADGREYMAGEYISAVNSGGIAQIRMRVFDARTRGEPNIICAECHTPVYPRKHFNTGKFHFVHIYDDTVRDCPYNENSTRLSTERIDSKRYNGLKEGPEHKHLKELLRASIDADPQFDSKKTKEEKNWYGATDESKWRRPDIAATRLYEGSDLNIAFEIQLSSTYLKVIAARRKFYLENKALLFWIFKDATGINPRQCQDDLFYNNNYNMFVVDEETLRLSQERGKLVFRCSYYEPVMEDDTIRDVWRERFVCFDELNIDIKNHRVYWFDYERENTRIGQLLLEKEKQKLRERYEGFWIRYHKERSINSASK